jgi:hypothetical protein
LTPKAERRSKSSVSRDCIAPRRVVPRFELGTIPEQVYCPAITGSDLRGRRWLRDPSRSRLHQPGSAVMAHSIQINRISNRTNDYDAEHLEAARAAIAHGKVVLKDSGAVDAFAGRKTQEPFPDGNVVKQ